MKYRKKPVVIEAVQLRWDTWPEMCEHANVGRLVEGRPQGCGFSDDGSPLVGVTTEEIGMVIPTLEGVVVARENDWIIKGVAGELYPCKPDIFAATYEEVGTDVYSFDFEYETRHIREWVRGGTVSTEKLRDQLLAWAEWAAEPARTAPGDPHPWLNADGVEDLEDE
jgi:hypothetical protein